LYNYITVHGAKTYPILLLSSKI